MGPGRPTSPSSMHAGRVFVASLGTHGRSTQTFCVVFDHSMCQGGCYLLALDERGDGTSGLQLAGTGLRMCDQGALV